MAQRTFTEEEVKQMLTQAWRVSFLSTSEGNNGEYCDDSDGCDEACSEDVQAILDGTQDLKPSIQECFAGSKHGSRLAP